jgi:hypothetical protein
MADAALMKLVAQTIVIWRQCWNPQICINIPFDGRKCIGATICVSIIEDNGTFYIEGSIDGASARYALANACIPVYSVGIASLEICVTNLTIANGDLKSLTLSVKACIGGKIGGINLQQCWDLFNQTINFHSLTADEAMAMIGVTVEPNQKASSWSTQKFMTYSVPTLETPRDESGCQCE